MNLILVTHVTENGPKHEPLMVENTETSNPLPIEQEPEDMSNGEGKGSQAIVTLEANKQEEIMETETHSGLSIKQEHEDTPIGEEEGSETVTNVGIKQGEIVNDAETYHVLSIKEEPADETVFEGEMFEPTTYSEVKQELVVGYRGTRSKRSSPESVAEKYVSSKCDPQKFYIKIFPLKGRGVVAKTAFQRGEFLLQYAGALKSADEANTLENVSSSGFRYFFQYKKKELCIDATAEPTAGPFLGRLVNHGDRHEVNCKMKVVVVNNTPTLCLFAVKDILVGQELLYDYGTADLPWKSKVLTEEGSTELKSASATVDTNLADDDMSADLSSMTPINSRDKFSSTDVKSRVAATGKHLTADKMDTTPCKAVNADTTEKDANKSADFQLSDGDCNNEVIFSDLEETIEDSRAYLMLLNMSNGVSEDSFSSEQTANANHTLEIEHTQTVCGKSLCNTAESEEEDPTFFPGHFPQSEEWDSDTSEEFPFYQRTSLPHSSHQVSGEDPALQPDVLECSSSSVTSSSSSNVAQQGSSHRNVTDSGHSSSDGQVTSSTDARASPYAKPYRLCIFCDSFKSKLSQHIAKQHSDIDRVAKAMKLPKAQKMKVFDSFRKEGILKINKQQAKMSKPSYHRERACNKKDALVMCNICSGFYSKYYLKKHSNVCQGKSESTPVAVPVDLLSHEQEFSTHFVSEVMSRFRQDEIGKLCMNDSWLIKIGKRLWEKQRSKDNKRTEVRKSVMTDMRRLAALYLEMQKAEGELGELPAKEGDVSDIFKRTNFSHLETAISNYTSSESSEPNSLKAGLKLSLYYLLKSTAKFVKGTYLIEDEDELSGNVDKFVSVLELSRNYLFGDATYKINQQRQIKLRQPESLPQEDDVRRLRDYTIQRMECITNDEPEFWDLHRYVELRDLVVCRLTLFNAGRGGEPSRLLMSEWTDAENDVWINKQQFEAHDDIDKALAGNFKVAYQSGKGNKHLVPVLFPKDTIEPVRKLCNKDLRKEAKIASNNMFLFPTINGSENHVSGWHAVSNVCDKVNLSNKETLTATKNRHRLSTLSALMDVPEAERHYIYKHMGHSEEANQHIYQTPLAVKELTGVGKCLQAIDEGDNPSCSGTSAESLAASLSDRGITQDDIEGLPEQTEDGLESVVFKPKRKYCKWTSEESLTVKNCFRKYFLGMTDKRFPGRKEIEAFLKEHKLNKDWKTVHTKVMNEVRKVEKVAERRQEQWD